MVSFQRTSYPFKLLRMFHPVGRNWGLILLTYLSQASANAELLASKLFIFHKIKMAKYIWMEPMHGAYYALYFNKQTMILHDTSKVMKERCHDLEHYSRVINYNLRGIIYAHL